MFWDVDFNSLTWENDLDLVILRILTRGDWTTIKHLRKKVSDKALRDWMLRRKGRGLDPRRLRFWELILGIDHRIVSGWMQRARTNPWYNRLNQ